MNNNKEIYTVIKNDILNDSNISLECKALYSIIKMLSKGDVIKSEDVISFFTDKEPFNYLYVCSNVESMISELYCFRYVEQSFSIDYVNKQTVNYIKTL